MTQSYMFALASASVTVATSTSPAPSPFWCCDPFHGTGEDICGGASNFR